MVLKKPTDIEGNSKTNDKHDWTDYGAVALLGVACAVPIGIGIGHSGCVVEFAEQIGKENQRQRVEAFRTGTYSDKMMVTHPDVHPSPVEADALFEVSPAYLNSSRQLQKDCTLTLTRSYIRDGIKMTAYGIKVEDMGCQCKVSSVPHCMPDGESCSREVLEDIGYAVWFDSIMKQACEKLLKPENEISRQEAKTNIENMLKLMEKPVINGQ